MSKLLRCTPQFFQIIKQPFLHRNYLKGFIPISVQRRVGQNRKICANPSRTYFSANSQENNQKRCKNPCTPPVANCSIYFQSVNRVAVRTHQDMRYSIRRNYGLPAPPAAPFPPEPPKPPAPPNIVSY